jgi:hypothetical protein
VAEAVVQAAAACPCLSHLYVGARLPWRRCKRAGWHPRGAAALLPCCTCRRPALRGGAGRLCTLRSARGKQCVRVDVTAGLPLWLHSELSDPTDEPACSTRAIKPTCDPGGRAAVHLNHVCQPGAACGGAACRGSRAAQQHSAAAESLAAVWQQSGSPWAWHVCSAGCTSYCLLLRCLKPNIQTLRTAHQPAAMPSLATISSSASPSSSPPCRGWGGGRWEADARWHAESRPRGLPGMLGVPCQAKNRAGKRRKRLVRQYRTADGARRLEPPWWEPAGGGTGTEGAGIHA